MAFLAFLLLANILFDCTQSSQCPAKYLRFSTNHTFCKDPQCQTIRRGISRADINTILDLHNNYRSLVVTGKVKSQNGDLPPASDMLQMVWDQELAALAQKHADQCIFKHDCNECRQVENFPVGQNLFINSLSCGSNKCPEPKPEWKHAITAFYEEVKLFDKKQIGSFTKTFGVGHFTQLIWSRSWRIGCGYVLFKEDNSYKSLHTCNYGPAGNVRLNSIYEIGKPCSRCPLNTCCGESCRRSYPGLCKIIDLSRGPQYSKLGNDKDYYCDWDRDNPYCSVHYTGNWHIQKSLNGNYATVIVNGSQTASLNFLKPFYPKESSFCLKAMIRKGSLSAANTDSSSLKLSLKLENRSNPIEMPLSVTNNDFVAMYINLGWPDETKISFIFGVSKSSSPSHILDIKDVEFYNGKCKNH